MIVSCGGFQAGRPGTQMLAGHWPWQPACPAGLAWPWSGGQHPGAVAAGQALAGQVGQVEGGGTAREPGVGSGPPR